MVKLRTPEAPAQEAPEQEQAAPFRDRVPSNWEISGSAEHIVARSNVTAEVYEGTIAEFNRRMRG